MHDWISFTLHSKVQWCWRCGTLRLRSSEETDAVWTYFAAGEFVKRDSATDPVGSNLMPPCVTQKGETA